MIFMRTVFPRAGGIIVVKPWKIAYARVPKAGNTAIKVAMSQVMGFAKAPPGEVTRDAYWRSVDPKNVLVVSPGEFASARYRDYFCFSVVRHPFDRVVSCYKNKILRNKNLRNGFRQDGFSAGMTLDAFVTAVSRTRDRTCNVHIRSQTAMLVHRGQLLPQVVIKLEELDAGWHKIVTGVRRHCGVELPSLGTMNTTASVHQDEKLSPAHEKLLQTRYASDFQNFYPPKMNE